MINVILYHPEIPQNTGNIMRTCVAMNARLHIIGPLPFSIDDKSLKRAGMDYIDSLELFYYHNYEEFYEKFSDKIAENLGGRVVGIYRDEMTNAAGELCDVKEYELLRADYLKKKYGNGED